MKSKYLFIFGLIACYSVIYGQENIPQYDLYSMGEIQNQDDCIHKNSSDLYELGMVGGDISAIKNTKVKIWLNEDNYKEFSDFREAREFDIMHWLLSSSAFNHFKWLNFEFISELNDGTIHKQKKTYCIVLKKSIKSIETTASFIKKPNYVKMSVYFATDRNDTGNNDVNNRFGSERSDLKYGKCEVSIPNNHKVGEIETPSIWRFEFSEDPKKHVVVHKASLFDKALFFNKLKNDIQKSDKKKSFLFVHGYNVSFINAAKRTAQISYDLLFDGEAVFYSWPSKASTASYTVDEANIEWAQTNIKHFLEDYLQKSEAEEIYLVAHSMGNRGLTKALIELLTEKPELKNSIKEVILAAPDIDADVFRRDIAPQMVEKIDKPITLYVSSDDVALKASHQVHGSSRAGDAGDGIVLVNGVETIDASGIDTSFLSHSYFAETSSIIKDIYDLIKLGKRAFQRERLKRINLNEKSYWKVKKKQE